MTASESPTVAVKDEVHAAINQQRATFIELAYDIHQHPELAFAEAYAAERITQVVNLAPRGIAMKRSSASAYDEVPAISLGGPSPSVGFLCPTGHRSW